MAAPSSKQSSTQSSSAHAEDDDVKYLYVMAHGAGSATLDPAHNFISFNNFARKFTTASETPFIEDPHNKYPLIYRLTTTGKSVVSDYDSDRANVNEMLHFLTDGTLRDRFHNAPQTRGTENHEGYRTFSELYTDMQHFGPNDKMYNEMVEVEVDRNKRIRKGKGTDDEPGGFGIFIYDGKDWVDLDSRYGDGVVDSILLKSNGEQKDVSILEIAYKLVEVLGTRIVVINPNCSPPSDAALVNERQLFVPYIWKERRFKMMNPNIQFLLGLDFAGRVQSNFKGIEKTYQIRTGAKSPPGKPKITTNASAATYTSYQEDRTGIIEPGDLSAIFIQFFYFFKDYYDWNELERQGKSSGSGSSKQGENFNQSWLQNLKDIFGQEFIVDDMYAGKFLLILLLLIFRLNDKQGGIVYKDDKKLIKKLAEESSDDDDEVDDVSGKGRLYLWSKIMGQSKWGAAGRRQNNRTIEGKHVAQEQLKILMTAVESIARRIESSDVIKPKHVHFEELKEHAKQFALEAPNTVIKGGKKKKNKKTRKKKKKTKRNSPTKKRKTRRKKSYKKGKKGKKGKKEKREKLKKR